MCVVKAGVIFRTRTEPRFPVSFMWNQDSSDDFLKKNWKQRFFTKVMNQKLPNTCSNFKSLLV
jgi:hypothetical protein